MKSNLRNSVIYRSHHSVFAIGVATIVTVGAFICKARSVTKVDSVGPAQALERRLDSTRFEAYYRGPLSV